VVRRQPNQNQEKALLSAEPDAVSLCRAQAAVQCIFAREILFPGRNGFFEEEI